MKQLLFEGAEAKLYKDNDIIIKERIPKLYRIKELDDKIRKQRNRVEVKLLKQYRQSKKMMKMMKGMESEQDVTKLMKKFKGKMPKGIGF